MSLADELLADLEDGGDDIADELQESDQTKLEDIAEEVEDVSMQVDTDKLNSVHSIAKLRDSKQVLILCSNLISWAALRARRVFSAQCFSNFYQLYVLFATIYYTI